MCRETSAGAITGAELRHAGSAIPLAAVPSDGGVRNPRGRLERGRFVWPRAEDGVASLTPAQLSMLLEARACQPGGMTSKQIARLRISLKYTAYWPGRNHGRASKNPGVRFKLPARSWSRSLAMRLPHYA
jgi:hypothetical protein